MNFRNIKFYERGVWSFVALCLCASGVQPAVAQCLSNTGASATDLSLQTWPRALNPVAITSFSRTTYSEGQSTTTTTDFKNITSVTTDDTGAVYILDVGAAAVYRMTGLSGSNPIENTYIDLNTSPIPPTPPKPAFPSGVLPTAIFYAGGTLWAAMPSGAVASLAVIQGNNLFETRKTIFPTFSIGAHVTGATFDGQYVWFSTAQGSLLQVVPASVRGVGNSEVIPPSLVATIPTGWQSPLSGPIFDGTTIWVTSQDNLLGFNPQTGSVTGSNNLGTSLSNPMYDGVFLWMIDQSNNEVIKYDPVLSQVISRWPASPGNLIYTGSFVATYGAQTSQTVVYRACDGHKVGAGSPALSATFDGNHLWMAGGTGLLIW